MKNLLFFGIPTLFLLFIEISVIFNVPLPFVNCFAKKTVETTYFTDKLTMSNTKRIIPRLASNITSNSDYFLKKTQKDTSHNRVPSIPEKLGQTLYRHPPSQDTTKKKVVVPNKNQSPPAVQKVVLNEIDGLVIDATFSPGGYDFYVDFSQNWTAPIGAENYTIVVKEYPGRGVNIVVAIEVNGKQLVNRRMRPIYPAIHSLSVAAANYLNGYIAQGNHLRGIDADGNFIDVQQTGVTRQIKTPFDIY